MQLPICNGYTPFITLIRKDVPKSARAVSHAMTALLTPYQKNVYTVTFDNGPEIAGHAKIAATLQPDFYLAPILILSVRDQRTGVALHISTREKLVMVSI